MYSLMEKIKQRNWLLIITGCLVLASVLVFIMTTRRNLGIGVCYYNDVEYFQNELVPNYQGRSDCYCSWTGEIVCEESETTMSYEDFTSNDLQFTYTFRNYIEQENPDLSRVILSNIKQKQEGLEVILEREALCTENSQAPVQTAMYKEQEDGLVLTTITNRDESLYSRVCIIGNTFVIDNLDLTKESEESEYSLFYQNDNGQIFKLNTCFVNGKLYGQGDVFKDAENNLLCTCEGPEVECEGL
jgi:hypothetical protein